MPCPVCQHNQTNLIDRALLAGADPTSLSRKFGISLAAMRHHQEHLAGKMAQVGRRFHDNLHHGLFCKLTQVMEMVLEVIRQTKANGDVKFLLQASREFTRIINLMHKMAAKCRLDPEFIYCLLASPQWDLQENRLLPQGFQAVAENRQTMKLHLFASCPEPETAPEPETGQAILQDTQNPAAGIAGPESLVQAPAGSRSQTRPGGGQTSAAKARKGRKGRAKGAKRARKIGQPTIADEQNQLVTQREKNSPRKTRNLWQKLFRRWEKSGNLPGKTTLSEGITL